MIRPTRAADTPALLSMSDGTRVFKPMEIQALREVLDDYHSTNQVLGHVCVTYETPSEPVGFAYYAPAAMTDRTWYLYWIVVVAHSQANGIGSELLRQFETDVQERDGRLLLIETSSQPHYEPTRRFYLKHGYEIGTVIKDYYADNDDMVVFRKRLRKDVRG